ncbi:MAG TPA: DNA-processing protein DprA [Polyangiales bacterium]|nr:DNA-processing protein DprA [Polyangiales bacterium]
MLRPRAQIPLPAPPVTLRPTDPAWPIGLAYLTPADRPRQRFVAGALPDLRGAVAVVGTRYADEGALAFTHRLAAALARAGRTVISGGAAGIDAAAHRGCLDGGGRTLAVLATGLARAYPVHHAGLFTTIAGQGALICEDRDPSQVVASSFLQRNRLIAALAESVVVVQAPVRSGALSTATRARQLCRRLFVVPAAPWDVRGEGCLALVRSGAQICTSATDVLSVAGSGGRRGSGNTRRRAKEPKDAEELSESARALWKLLRRGPRYPDELSVCLDMPAARVQEALLTLQLVGRVRRRADGWYEKTGSP